MADFNTEEEIFDRELIPEEEAPTPPSIQERIQTTKVEDTEPLPPAPVIEEEAPKPTIQERIIQSSQPDANEHNQKVIESFVSGTDRKLKEREDSLDPAVQEEVEVMGERLGKDYLDEKREYLDTITLGRNYQDVMIGLDEQLQKEDDELLVELDDAKKDKAFKSLLIAGINVFAQLYAVQKGIEYKASGVHQKELKEDLLDKIDTIKIKRAQLAKRISSAKQLVDTTYRQRKSTEYREEAVAERERREAQAEELRQSKAEISSEKTRQAEQRRLNAALKQFYTAPRDRQEEILRSRGLTEEQIEEIVEAPVEGSGIFGSNFFQDTQINRDALINVLGSGSTPTASTPTSRPKHGDVDAQGRIFLINGPKGAGWYRRKTR